MISKKEKKRNRRKICNMKKERSRHQKENRRNGVSWRGNKKKMILKDNIRPRCWDQAKEMLMDYLLTPLHLNMNHQKQEINSENKMSNHKYILLIKFTFLKV